MAEELRGRVRERVACSCGAALEQPYAFCSNQAAQQVQSLAPLLSVAKGTRWALPGGQVAEELRGRVRERTRVTCSCGVAPNRLLAKIASDINKPDGQYVLPGETGAVAAFMARLPIRKVPGIGKVGPPRGGMQGSLESGVEQRRVSLEGEPFAAWRCGACCVGDYATVNARSHLSLSC